MPRVKNKAFFNYTEEQMNEAIADVRRGLATATAAKIHGVPRVTLMYKVKGKTPTIRKMGRESYLTSEEERVLVTWILTMAKVGFPIGKDQLLDSVQHLMVELKRKNPFSNNRPGKKWYSSFLRRNPDVSQRTAQNLTITRASVTTEQLKNWFDEIYTYLTENNYADILDDPQRIFNADETAFFLNPKGEKVLAARGEKTVYKVINSDEKECLTVLITGNAGGELAPPMVIFRYERIPKELAASVPEFWGIGKSENGWMTGETFFEFISNIFYPWLVEKKIQFPVILLIDGHVSHLTLHVSQFCEQHKIILIALFPNSTHKIQPMDVAVFRTLKAGWRDNVQQWRLENYDSPVLKKIHFCPLLKKTLEERINTEILQNGFRKCGLFPWNPNAIEQEAQKVNTLTGKMKETELREISKGLDFIEKYVDEEKIKKFKNHTVWNGDITDQSLFEFYRKILTEKNDLEKETGLEVEPINETQNEGLVEITDGTEETEKSINADKDNKNHQNGLAAEGGGSKRMKDFEDVNIILTEDNPEMNPLIYETLINTTPIKESTKGNICFAENVTQQNEGLDKNVPTPFKRALFWPGPKPSKAKRYKKEKVPSVTTSKSWQLYYERKQLKKKTLEEEKKKKIDERKKKKEMKIAEKENALKMKKDKKNKRKRDEYIDTTSEEEWVPSESSAEDVSLFENEDFIDDEKTESENDYKEGDYILVSFPGKNRNLQFVCVIQEKLDNNELEIVGMKKYADCNNVFVLNETDVSTIEKSQIMKVLPFPNMSAAGDRLKYEFPENLNVDG